jgi:hypothetical protein
MISATTADVTALLPLNAEFNCFDPIDDDDTDADLLDDRRRKPEAVFDGTRYGYDTFVTPEPAKKKTAVKNKTANKIPEPLLEEYTTGERRIDLLTRTYEPSGFDKEPRPQWTPPQAANENQKRKHSFPALDEARNNTLMTGRGSAHTLIQNEWAFDILIEIHDLLDAAAPRSSWLAHNGHGAADEQETEESVDSGFGMDVVHDYGPSEEKIKKLWEHNDDLPDGETPKQSKNGQPWILGTVELKTVLSEPSNTAVMALSRVGALQNSHRNHIAMFRDSKGKWLKLQTRTRRAKGTSAPSKLATDPRIAKQYTGAALPRNKRGEVTAGFFGGTTASSNSVKPNTLDHAPEAGPSHSSSDPWAVDMAADEARDDATVRLAEYRLIVGDRPYEALTQAASGFRIGELCGGRLGNTTDSARARNFLQIAIERIIEERSRSLFHQNMAA